MVESAGKRLLPSHLFKKHRIFQFGNMLGNKQLVHILFFCDDEHYDLFLFVLETVDTIDFF